MRYLYQISIFLNNFRLKAKIVKTCTGLSKELLKKLDIGELGPDGYESCETGEQIFTKFSLVLI